MAKIKPFKAVIYNQEKMRDLSCVVCPPYDIISTAKQQYYHERDSYNFIHLLLGKDIPGEDKYRRAGQLFRDWLKQGVFIRDERPAIYFCSQQYKFKGEKRTRLGFISLLRLENKKQSIFGHEHTRLEPKEDRFRLIKQVKANLSPIFVVFSDKKRIIQRTYEQGVRETKPFIDITDDEMVIHRLWRLDSEDLVENFKRSLERENIFIADGHHRFEVACAYRDLMKQRLRGSLTGEEDFDYLLTYFTNTDSRGLTILPMHRLVRLERGLDLQDFLKAIADYFYVERVKDKTQFFFMMEKAGYTEHVLGIRKDKKYWLLRLKNIKILEKEIPDKSREYRMLDISILNNIILKKILAIDAEADKDRFIFSPDAESLLREADNNPLYIAFFLNPARIQQVISVALAGQRLPSKSTYFYPKVLSGLVINKFEM